MSGWPASGSSGGGGSEPLTSWPDTLDDDRGHMDSHEESADCAIVVEYQAVVVREHKATDKRQLNLHVGDVVIVLEDDPSGWLGGHKVGEDFTGWFPKFCVKELPADNARLADRTSPRIAASQSQRSPDHDRTSPEPHYGASSSTSHPWAQTISPTQDQADFGFRHGTELDVSTSGTMCGTPSKDRRRQDRRSTDIDLAASPGAAIFSEQPTIQRDRAGELRREVHRLRGQLDETQGELSSTREKLAGETQKRMQTQGRLCRAEEKVRECVSVLETIKERLLQEKELRRQGEHREEELQHAFRSLEEKYRQMQEKYDQAEQQLEAAREAAREAEDRHLCGFPETSPAPAISPVRELFGTAPAETSFASSLGHNKKRPGGTASSSATTLGSGTAADSQSSTQPAMLGSSAGLATGSGSSLGQASWSSVRSMDDTVRTGHVRDRVKHFEKFRAVGRVAGLLAKARQTPAGQAGEAVGQAPCSLEAEPLGFDRFDRDQCFGGRPSEQVDFNLSPLERTPERHNKLQAGRLSPFSRWASCRGA
eukprot:TRINITY_DN10096_c0_g1_i1.p1 TRINITY_DN10096_c0_g1~~TRINITY_DN10096_c0_g1_i1.p1  ORF type:complete len:539 (+),score=104.54 TRINITY_DN10096_c0_g1_i1:106-1722(+)